MADEWIFTNNAVTRIVGALSNSDTVITVEFQQGALFPNPTGAQKAKVTLEDRRNGITEICDLISKTGDQLTVERGAEGTVAQSWPDQSHISCRATAEAYNSIQTRIDDAIAAALLTQQDLMYPVGGVYIEISGVNPATTLGFGTWVEHAAGRALVGVGNNGEQQWTVGFESGAQTHTLVANELASHLHGLVSANTAYQGGHIHGLVAGATAVAGNHQHSTLPVIEQAGGGSGPHLVTTASAPNAAVKTDFAGDHQHGLIGTTDADAGHFHEIDGTTDLSGGDLAHNNLQPSIGIYIWRRTA